MYIARVRLTDGDLKDEYLGDAGEDVDEHLVRKEQQEAAAAISRMRAGGSGAPSSTASPTRASAGPVMDSVEVSRALSNKGIHLDARPFEAFISQLKLRSVPASLKRRELPWCMRIIEEIYDERYKREHEMLAEEEAGGAPATRASVSFPESVVKYISKRYGLSSIVEQNCLDLLHNVVRCRSEVADCDIFARLLEQHYDSDELLFLLYVRSVAQKVLGNVSFRAMWSEMGRGAGSRSAGSGLPSSRPRLDERQCSHIARIVYGSEANELYLSFMTVVREHLRSSGEASVDVGTFLHMAVEEYHETTGAERAEDAAASGSADGRGDADTARLVSQAERGFAERQRDGAGSAGTGPASAGDRASTGGDTVEESRRQLLERLSEELRSSNEEYVNQLMTGMGDMTDEAAEQVQAQLTTTLSQEVDRLLMQAIQDTDRGSRAVDEETNPIGACFHDVLVLADAAEMDDDEAFARIDRLCGCITHSDDVRKCMEPVVTLMIRVAGGDAAAAADAASSFA
jgi:hypothetical protein